MRKHTIACAAILASLSPQAVAFEGYEHKRASDLAYHVALSVHCGRHPDALACRQRDAFLFDPLADGGASDELTYGDIVTCVDAFLTPDKQLAFRAGGKKKPTSDTLPATRSEWGLKRSECGGFSLSALQAAHVNHSHFQMELVTSQRGFHALATGLAAAADANLFKALVVNAIGDHYLQDFFAPGHIATPRARLTDLFSNAMHDEANRFDESKRRGFHLFLAGEGEQSAKSVLAVLSRNGRGDGALLDLDEASFQMLALAPEECPSGCESKDGPEQLPPTERQRVAAAYRELVEKMGKVPAYGDGMLWRRDALHQRLVLLAYQVRSILDVLESAVTRQNVNTLSTVSWSAPSGHEVEASLGGLEYRVTSVCRKEDCDSRRSALTYSMVFGVSARREYTEFGDRAQRVTYSIETVPFGFLSVSPAGWNFGPAFGYSRFEETHGRGHAWTVRPTLVIPQTETMVGIPMEWQVHYGSSVPTRRFVSGIRVDQGFTSFLTLFVQAGRTSAMQADGQVKRGRSVGLGVEIAAPLTRIPLLNHLTR